MIILTLKYFNVLSNIRMSEFVLSRYQNEHMTTFLINVMQICKKNPRFININNV